MMGNVKTETEVESDDTFTLNIDNINDTSFEFPCLSCETNTCPVTADEIFSEGKIRPVFINPNNNSKPLAKNVCKPPVKALTRKSLSSLFTEDKEFNILDDELDGVSRVTDCKWTPQKSSSTGTSKRWKLLSLLRRCSSDSRDGLAFYDHNEDVAKGHKCDSGKVDATILVQYPSKKVEKYGNHRRSFLPYKQDLIGLFANLSNKPGSRKWEPSRTLTS